MDGLWVKREDLGSSPLTRGKPLTQFKLSGSDGLIPTHAGKTVNTMKPTISVPAHPHSRGENEAAIQAGADTAGASPLTRGKHP